MSRTRTLIEMLLSRRRVVIDGVVLRILRSHLLVDVMIVWAILRRLWNLAAEVDSHATLRLLSFLSVLHGFCFRMKNWL